MENNKPNLPSGSYPEPEKLKLSAERGEKFKEKYRISSARLPLWNYNSAAAYFVTICTHNRTHFFGEVVGGEVQLTEIGLVVRDEWLKTPGIRPDMNMDLDEFVVMPNHFHGIIGIGENKFNTGGMDNNCRDAMHGVSTVAENQFGPQRKNLASIIRGFKSAVTTYARKNNIEFAWQSRFYDHIIRDNDSYLRIREYIRNNPLRWDEDKYKN
jgi:putative transposase